MEAPDFHTFLSSWLIVYLLLNATVISFSDNSKVFAFILKQVFVIKNIENASQRRTIGAWKMAQLVKCLSQKHEDLSEFFHT